MLPCGGAVQTHVHAVLLCLDNRPCCCRALGMMKQSVKVDLWHLCGKRRVEAFPGQKTQQKQNEKNPALKNPNWKLVRLYA